MDCFKRSLTSLSSIDTKSTVETSSISSSEVTCLPFDEVSAGKQTFIGSKTETALLGFARDYLGMGPIGEERSNVTTVQIVPFDSSRKCMASVLDRLRKVRIRRAQERARIKGLIRRQAQECARLEDLIRRQAQECARLEDLVKRYEEDGNPLCFDILDDTFGRRPTTTLKHDRKHSSLLRSGPPRKMPTTRRYVRGVLGETTVWAVPDTGAQGNFIPAKLARKHGWTVHASSTTFRLANGRKARTCGFCYIPWKFSHEDNVFHLRFEVIEDGLDDIILGNEFLKETQTLTHNSRRLHERPIGNRNSYPSLNIGTPTQHLPGFIDSQRVSAFADTGCELNIMSESYAHSRGYDLISHSDYQIGFEFADGTRTVSTGYVEVHWAFEEDPGNGVITYFDILPNAAYDIILGADMLFGNEIFRSFSDRLVPAVPMSELLMLALVICHIERRKQQIEVLQEEERRDDAEEQYRYFQLQSKLQNTSLAERQDIMAEDERMRREWQERSANRQAQLATLSRPLASAPPESLRTKWKGVAGIRWWRRKRNGEQIDATGGRTV